MLRPFFVLAFAASVAAQTSFGPTRHAGLPPLAVLPQQFARGDIDGDGDLDLVVSGDLAPIRVLVNDGNGRFVDATAGRLVTPGTVDNHAIDLADIDGDGDLDVLAANEDFLPNFVFRNNGTGVFTDVSATALPANAFDTKNQVIADFDGDGDLDWLAVDLGGCHYYANNGAGVFTDVSATRLVGVSNQLGDDWYKAPAATDLDGDGDLDVVAPGPGGLLRNQGGVLSPFPTQLPAPASAPHWLADVDADGDVDVFAGAGALLYRNQGNATFVAATGYPLPTGFASRYGCFDVDRDGDVDVYGANALLLNDGTGAFTAQATTQATQYGLPLGSVAADYDRDGDLELPGLPNLLHHVLAPVAPTLGGNYAVTVHARTGTPTLAAVVGAFGAGTTPAGPFGSLRLDPASALVVFVHALQPAPTTANWGVPNVAALVGTQLHYQAIVVDPLVGYLTTNSFRDVVQ